MKPKTWSAGNKPARPRGPGGFTLLELLVVLVVLAALVALTPPLITGMLPGLQAKAAVREVASLLHYSRGQAIRQGTPVDVVFDLDAKTFGRRQTSQRHAIPAAVALETYTAELDALPGQQAVVRFYPDGGSSGGQIRLRYQEATYQLDIDWLTGRIQSLGE